MEQDKTYTNKYIINKVMDKIKELGYTPIDIKYGNSYFIFEGEKDSVCHFHIKEIPKFIFGLWSIDRYDSLEHQLKNNVTNWVDYLGISTKTQMIFFTQYERDMDKFKPSRSGFVTGLYLDSYTKENDNGEIVDVEEICDYELEDILSFMKKHPIKAYTYSEWQTKNVWNEMNGITCLKIYLRNTYYHYKYKIKESLERWYVTKSILKVLNKLETYNYYLFDYGDCCSPRLHLWLRFKDDENINKERENYEDKLLEQLEDKFFNSVSYNFLNDSDKRKDKKLKKHFNSLKTLPDRDTDVILIKTNIN